MNISKLMDSNVNKPMTDEEFEELETKYEAEKKRREKLQEVTSEYYSVKNKVDEAFRECGLLLYIKSIKIVAIKMSDRTGDGRGGMDEEKIEIPIEDRKTLRKCLDDYLNELKKQVIKLGGKLDD